MNVYSEIEAEILRAVHKHGPYHMGGEIKDSERIEILEGELEEVRDAYIYNRKPPHDVRSELIDLAASAVQWWLRLSPEVTHHPASEYAQGVRAALAAVIDARQDAWKDIHGAKREVALGIISVLTDVEADIKELL